MTGSQTQPDGDVDGRDFRSSFGSLFLRHLLDNPASMSWIYDPGDARYLFCSEAAIALYGRKPEEMAALGINEVLTGDAARRIMSEVGGASASYSPNFRFDEYRDDGSVFHTEATVAYEGAGARRLVVGTTRDVTGERRRRWIIRDSDSLLNFIAENAGDLIWTYDFQLDRYTYVSSAIMKLRGFTPEEALEQRLLDALTPASAEKASRLVVERIEALKRGDMSAKFGIDEFEQVCKDGSTVMTEVMSTFVLDERGQVTGIVGVARDITERIQKEELQKELEKKLYEAQKNDSIGRIAGGVAHELNNALTPIAGYAEMLRKVLPHEMYGYIDAIAGSASRAASLIDQLLDFTRSQFLDLRAIDLQDAVLSFEQLLRSSIRENIELSIRHDGSSPRVRIDLQKFRQIIVNLALNAQDAMPLGGRISVDIGTALLDGHEADATGMSEGPCARFVVADDGAGIPPEALPNIFDPFFTTKHERLASGLGLSSVYGIVKQLGGHIRVDSALGYGTTMSISLPLFVPADGFGDGNGEAGRESGSSGARTIMIVEDDPMVRSLILDILGEEGYLLLEAENAEACLRKATEHGGPIDLLLTDIIMPGMNGTQLADEIGAMHPGICVLFMSGYDRNMITESILLPENHHFLRKPFSARELASIVDSLVAPRGS